MAMARRAASGEISMERSVAKPEWGTKRICPSCGTRYYDLLRDPVICPKCSTPYDPEAFLKSRRARPAAPVEKELEPVGADELDTELETEEADVACVLTSVSAVAASNCRQHTQRDIEPDRGCAGYTPAPGGMDAGREIARKTLVR